MLESGKLVHKIGFEIDNKSWSNLNKFQQRIGKLKAQMKGLSGAVNLKVNATQFKQQAEKVAKIQQQAQIKVAKQKTIKGADRTYSSWWKDELDRKDISKKISRQRDNLSDRMNRSGVSSSSQKSFLEVFDRKAGIAMQTKDLASFNHEVNRSATNLMRQSKAAKSASSRMHDLRSTMVAATQAYTAFSVVQNVANTGMQLESMKAGMKIFAGDDQKVREQFDYIVEQSNRMGVNFEAAAQQFTKFSIVARNKMPEGQRRELFEGLSEYLTVLQADPEQYKRAFNSINQMLSKGSVMSEELKGQLSESAYGATEIFAKAMGVTEKELFKLMETGQVISAEVLPKVAKEFRKAAAQNGAFDAATKKTRSELNRFMTGLSLVKNEIYTGGFGKGLAYAFKGMADFLMASKDVSKVLGQALKGAMIGLTLPFEIIGILIKQLSDLFNVANNDTIRYTASIMGLVASMWALYRIGKMVAGVFGAMKWLTTALAATGGTGVVATAGALVAPIVAADAMVSQGKHKELAGMISGSTISPMASILMGITKMQMAGSKPEVNVNLNVNDGKVKDLITAEVQQNNTENLNSLLSSGTR